MAFVDSIFDGRQVDAPEGLPKLDAAGCYRLQSLLMLAMDEAGWPLRDIAALFGMDKATVHRRLRQIPEAARRHFAPTVADLAKWFPRPPGKRGAGLRRTAGMVSPSRSAGTPEQRRLAAEARLDGLCLAALDRYGRPEVAARSLGVQVRRVRAAVDRRRPGAPET